MPSVAEAAAYASQFEAAQAAGRAAFGNREGPKPASTRGRSQRFYASLAWRRLRYGVLAENAKRNGGVARCELCAAPAAAGAPLNVDHIEALSRQWDRRLDRTNLQVLCGACNHGKLDGPAQDFRQAEQGGGK